MAKPSLLVVVQRFGDVAGGAETHARMLATRLAEHADVTVATTTARDYETWVEAFPAGETMLDGLRVLRFPVRRRKPTDLRGIERRAFAPGHTLEDERRFIEAQGPVVPDLLEYLAREGRAFDHVLFFTYLYYPTVRGLPLVADRAVLVPTAHDEPPIRLTSYRALFHAPRAIAYNSDEERAFVHALFRNERVPNDVLGVGVDVPAGASGERFRRRHGIDGPILLYVGRIGESKGCDELIQFFCHRRDAEPSRRATLVLAGRPEMRIPKRPDLRHVGYLSDEEKFDAFAACDAFVLPSRFESLSIVALEAWASGRPVVCHADCAVLQGLARRSGGGLFYRSYGEFNEILDLLDDPRVRERLGANGRAFVEREYSWGRIVETYLDLFAEVRARNGGGSRRA